MLPLLLLGVGLGALLEDDEKAPEKTEKPEKAEKTEKPEKAEEKPKGKSK